MVQKVLQLFQYDKKEISFYIVFVQNILKLFLFSTIH